jgi:hypothetical protein
VPIADKSIVDDMVSTKSQFELECARRHEMRAETRGACPALSAPKLAQNNIGREKYKPQLRAFVCGKLVDLLRGAWTIAFQALRDG